MFYSRRTNNPNITPNYKAFKWSLVVTNIYFPEVSVTKPPKLDSGFVSIVSHRIGVTLIHLLCFSHQFGCINELYFYSCFHFIEPWFCIRLKFRNVTSDTLAFLAIISGVLKLSNLEVMYLSKNSLSGANAVGGVLSDGCRDWSMSTLITLPPLFTLHALTTLCLEHPVFNSASETWKLSFKVET